MLIRVLVRHATQSPPLVFPVAPPTMADAPVPDGRPQVLLRRVKVISGIIAALSLFSFFTGPTIVNIGWLILSILTFRVRAA